MSTISLKQLLIAIVFSIAIFQASADDGYFSYLADVHQVESNQLRAPDEIIGYADGEMGALVKAVMEPKRTRLMFDEFWRRKRQSPIEAETNLSMLVLPLIARYERANDAMGSRYENEYLDSLLFSQAIVDSSNTVLRESTVSAQSGDTSNLQAAGIDAKQLKKLNDSLKKLANFGTAAWERLQVTALKRKLDAGRFSDEGTVRAKKLLATLQAEIAEASK